LCFPFTPLDSLSLLTTSSLFLIHKQSDYNQTRSPNRSLNRRPKFAQLLVDPGFDGTDRLSVPRPKFAHLTQTSPMVECDQVLGRPKFARFVRTVSTV
ncbi:unnamed protein product, partial [Brassica oleracea]